MKIEKIVSKKVIACDSSSNIFDVCKKMKDYDIGFIPISKSNKIIGVITDRDIIIRVLNNDIDLNSKIESYITEDIISIDKDKTVDYAVDLMKKYQIKRLLVTNKNKIYGVLALSDIVSHDINPYKLLELLKNMLSIDKVEYNKDSEIDEFYL